MRRTLTLIWIPFIFSVGAISWSLLGVGLVLLAAVILTPAMHDVREAEKVRNDYQATLDLLDQNIALQKDFVQAANTDPLLMERLAARQLNLNRPDQEMLLPDAARQDRDRSVRSLLAESLQKVEPKPVEPIPPVLSMTMNGGVRSVMVVVACGALALSFFLGVKYERA